MTNPTVKKHPLVELIAKDLFSIETVPCKEQRAMVRRATENAAAWHDEQVAKLREALSKVERDVAGLCVWCNEKEGHDEHCWLDNILKSGGEK